MLRNMTRISNHHLLGASRRLPPRITLLASSSKYKVKEERKRILKLSVKKLRAIEDPEAFLTRSVLINNTLKRLQTEVREEKNLSKKSLDYNPSPYSFYSIEKAYREEMERLDSNGNPESTSSLSQGRLDSSDSVEMSVDTVQSDFLEADDEADSDSSSGSSSSSSSDDDSDGETETQNSAVKKEESSSTSSLEDDLLSEVYMPTPPPPPQMIGSIDEDIELKPSRPLTPVPWATNSNPSAEAVMKSTCDSNEADFLSEAVRTECWTKPVDTDPVSPVTSNVTSKSTLTSNSVNTVQSWPHLPDLSWPSYTPSASANVTSTASTASEAVQANFQPNITVPSCSSISHKENLYNSNSSQSAASASAAAASAAASNLSEKCYSCGQSSLFQSELQSVVFNSLIASLET